ncbi:type II toxin-antitoxin system RelE family toxin [Aerosakkonema funiforme]|uniref:type II toxin-antitoxin system RelE family toxin n=1 Tax=Aerosakkonema funiforme TaxID=1246630 RepID=UPI0035B9F332
MTYTVEIKPAAQRQIKKLTLDVQAQIIEKLAELELDPRPMDVQKLSGEENAYRVRVGDYRIIYEIYDRVLLVVVVKVGNRREIYRKK